MIEVLGNSGTAVVYSSKLLESLIDSLSKGKKVSLSGLFNHISDTSLKPFKQSLVINLTFFLKDSSEESSQLSTTLPPSSGSITTYTSLNLSKSFSNSGLQVLTPGTPRALIPFCQRV